jgi:predicted Zn-dependent peptidase
MNLKMYDKVKNKMEAYLLFGETNVMNRAMNLAYFEMLGDAALINSETDRYRAVTSEQLRKTAAEVFMPSRKNLLRYYSKS